MTEGYRVHVSADKYDHCTFLLLDVYDVESPEAAVAAAKEGDYFASLEDGDYWLGLSSRRCSTQVEEYAWPERLPADDYDDVVANLRFVSDEEDAL